MTAVQMIETKAYQIVARMDIWETGVNAIPAIVQLRKEICGISLIDAKKAIDQIIKERAAAYD